MAVVNFYRMDLYRIFKPFTIYYYRITEESKLETKNEPKQLHRLTELTVSREPDRNRLTSLLAMEDTEVEWLATAQTTTFLHSLQQGLGPEHLDTVEPVPCWLNRSQSESTITIHPHIEHRSDSRGRHLNASLAILIAGRPIL